MRQPLSILIILLVSISLPLLAEPIPPAEYIGDNSELEASDGTPRGPFEAVGRSNNSASNDPIRWLPATEMVATQLLGGEVAELRVSSDGGGIIRHDEERGRVTLVGFANNTLLAEIADDDDDDNVTSDNETDGAGEGNGTEENVTGGANGTGANGTDNNATADNSDSSSNLSTGNITMPLAWLHPTNTTLQEIEITRNDSWFTDPNKLMIPKIAMGECDYILPGEGNWLPYSSGYCRWGAGKNGSNFSVNESMPANISTLYGQLEPLLIRFEYRTEFSGWFDIVLYAVDENGSNIASRLHLYLVEDADLPGKLDYIHLEQIAGDAVIMECREDGVCPNSITINPVNGTVDMSINYSGYMLVTIEPLIKTRFAFSYEGVTFGYLLTDGIPTPLCSDPIWAWMEGDITSADLIIESNITFDRNDTFGALGRLGCDGYDSIYISNNMYATHTRSNMSILQTMIFDLGFIPPNQVEIQLQSDLFIPDIYDLAVHQLPENLTCELSITVTGEVEPTNYSCEWNQSNEWLVVGASHLRTTISWDMFPGGPRIQSNALSEPLPMSADPIKIFFGFDGRIDRVGNLSVNIFDGYTDEIARYPLAVLAEDDSVIWFGVLPLGGTETNINVGCRVVTLHSGIEIKTVDFSGESFEQNESVRIRTIQPDEDWEYDVLLVRSGLSDSEDGSSGSPELKFSGRNPQTGAYISGSPMYSEVVFPSGDCGVTDFSAAGPDFFSAGSSVVIFGLPLLAIAVLIGIIVMAKKKRKPF